MGPLGLGDDASDLDCHQLHHLSNLTDTCSFVKSTSSCDIDEGFVNYTQLLYCNLASLPVWLGCIFLIVWWLFMFSGLAVTADDFFCPSLAVISKSLKLSHNVAGVTFLAFGNGAPDVFSAVAAIGNAKSGDAGLAIGALFGAGVFVTAVVAGSISIIRPFQCMERPLMRDVIFYLAATYWSWVIMWDKKITQLEAAGLLMLYGVYVLVVIVGRYVNQKLKKRKAEALLNEGQSDPNEEDCGSRDPLLKKTTGAGHHNNSSSGSTESGRVMTYNSFSTGASSGEDIMSSMSDSDEYTLIGSTGGSPNIQVEMDAVARFHHLQHRTEASDPLWKLFLAGANPINIEEWSDLGLHWKIYEVFKCPIVLCLKLTVPVVDDENEEEEEEEEDQTDKDEQEANELKVEVEPKGRADDLRNWNRPLNCAQIFLGPVFASIVTGVGTTTMGATFPVYGLVIILAAALSVGIFLTTKTNERPRFHAALAYLGFLVSVVWIYCIANEIVNILQTLGIVFDLSDAILGLTLLAWGNSIGDLIADTSMARQGYPRMGISACFGGPLFNMLIGLGIPFTIACAKNDGVFYLKVTLEEMVLAAGLGLSLIATLIIVPLSNFHMSRPYGIFLLVLYVVFLLVAILTEVDVIKNVVL